MWATLDKISEQVTKYTTFLGQFWYVCVFIFRLIVVASLGGAVYGDEQSAFKCSQDLFGCSNMCYNEFAKISHLRFWAFQLIAVISPTVLFHFYSLHVSGQIQKLKNSENQMKQLEDTESNPEYGRETRKFSRRLKSVGHVKIKQVYSNNALQEVFYTNKIKIAYNISVLLRLALEGLFIYFASQLFNVQSRYCFDGIAGCNEEKSFFEQLWLEVPAIYHCTGPVDSDVHRQCYQHFVTLGKTTVGFVPCTVSRPYEKTVFLRYMMVLSMICFVVCILELLVAIARKVCRRKSWSKLPKRHLEVQRDSVFSYGPFVAAPTAPAKLYDEAQYFPNLAVPVKLGNKAYLEKVKRNQSQKYDEKDCISICETVKSYV